METKNLGLLALIGLLLIGVIALSGCVGEKSEEVEVISPTEKNQSNNTPTIEEKSGVETKSEESEIVPPTEKTQKYDVLKVYSFIDNAFRITSTEKGLPCAGYTVLAP